MERKNRGGHGRRKERYERKGVEDHETRRRREIRVGMVVFAARFEHVSSAQQGSHEKACEHSAERDLRWAIFGMNSVPQ